MSTGTRKKLPPHPRQGPQMKVRIAKEWYVIALNDKYAKEWEKAFNAIWDEMNRTGEGGEQSTRIPKGIPDFYNGKEVELVEIDQKLAEELYTRQPEENWKFIVLRRDVGKKTLKRWKPSQSQMAKVAAERTKATKKLDAYFKSGVLYMAG